jgi:carbonic anhydrase
VAEGVDAEKALGWLKNGNTRYLTNHLRKDGRSQSDRNRLAKGQNPHTIVISCADSRVPPETIFDQSLGEIFVVRVAGEALDSSVIASVEYAVEHLGTKNILVMGHTSCGAVKAAALAKTGESAGSESLDKLVNDIKPRFEGRTIASSDLDNASVMNARGVAADLAQRSKIIQKAMTEKNVKISSSLYHIDSGKVDFLR